MTANSTPAERVHRRAVRFFWTWLVIATAVSLAGNVAHAWLTAPPGAARWLAGSVAVVPPTVLLLSVHGLAVLVKATPSGAVYWTAVAAIGVLAVGAFVLSFAALRDLAVIAGIRPGLAFILPLVIDVAIGVATLALAALGDKPARRGRTASRNATPPASPGATPKRAPATDKRAEMTTATRADAAAADIAAASSDADAATHELAADIVAAKVTRQDVAVVEKILAAHAKGDPLNRIAKDLGVHHTAVSKVIGAAAERRQRTLEAA